MGPETGDAGVVLLAAGGSTRMGGDKMLLELAGKPVIAYSLDAFQRSERVGSIVVVASSGNKQKISGLVSEYGFDKVIEVVEGGARRQDSTATGVERLLEADAPGLRWILVHDGARPFVDEAMIDRGLAAAVETGAAAPALPVSDTIKRVREDGSVDETLDRSTLRSIQTPQVFRLDVLAPALRPAVDVTDDVALIELAGGRVTLFDGHPDNIKLTTPDDMERAAGIASRRADAVSSAGIAPSGGAYRWGTGFDGHAFAPGGPLRLGGVDIEHDRHLEGHSDGDVLLHAVASAILGGAGLGDLGGAFPSDDPEYAGIDSRELLGRAASLAAGAGWVVSHVDATIIAQQPKLAPYVNRINESIAATLSIAVDSVNIKVTSTDHVGAIGKAEGIAAQAIVTLSARAINSPEMDPG
ncbi:MAG: 2-C-methyl-D-erythritol 4-phosphate cytidylyltransferase [Chloroflexi bacterium]|nr:2-C-methyl-D-erythritol 4-phosphate cytidylyltransferase [Chloroflexota bacterium]